MIKIRFEMIQISNFEVCVLVNINLIVKQNVLTACSDLIQKKQEISVKTLLNKHESLRFTTHG